MSASLAAAERPGARRAVRSATTTAVWCGFEGVLTPPVPQLVRELADRVHVPGYALSQAIAAVAGPERGRTGAAYAVPPAAGPEWAGEVERVLDEEFGLDCDLSGFREIWRALCRPSTAWRDTLGLLRRQGVFAGLLVPGPWDALPGWLHRDRTGLFDGTAVCSAGPDGLPGAEAFEWALRISGRPAWNSVLVDADEHRCARAREAGWHSVLFRRADEAAEELSRLLSRPSAETAAPARRNG